MTTISATTILSSQHEKLPKLRLNTILTRYPRFFHSENMTHRALTRNSSSSRAIKVDKLIREAMDDPAMPLYWTKEQKGMQGYQHLEGDELEAAKYHWNQGRLAAIEMAGNLAASGAHKQLVNRYLEPYTHITVLFTSTNWANYLALRDHHAAEPHIAHLAREICKELEKPAMQVLMEGEWHTPFIREQEYADLLEEDRLKKSSAHCASTSYKTVDGFDLDMDRAYKIYEKLVDDKPVHASPFEHVAQADYYLGSGVWMNPRDHRNFTGFNQYRAYLEQDTIHDDFYG